MKPGASDRLVKEVHAMNTVDTVTILNRLIVTSKNGESALRSAADEAWHEELKQSLSEYASFFGKAALELQEEVRKIGGRPRGLGTFGNTLHRTWMHIRAKSSGQNEEVILDEVERDESEADALYDDAIRNWDTPPEVHALLERQAQEARRRHEAIHQLRARLIS
jgi:uncharacterized protein (TIGR02284 family)